jgi:hypothetical protein
VNTDISLLGRAAVPNKRLSKFSLFCVERRITDREFITPREN